MEVHLNLISNSMMMKNLNLDIIKKMEVVLNLNILMKMILWKLDKKRKKKYLWKNHLG